MTKGEMKMHLLFAHLLPQLLSGPASRAQLLGALKRGCLRKRCVSASETVFVIFINELVERGVLVQVRAIGIGRQQPWYAFTSKMLGTLILLWRILSTTPHHAEETA